MRMLTRNPMNMLRLTLKDSFLGPYINAPSSDPSGLLRDLVAGLAADPNCLIERCHLYPLGGLKKSADWMYKVQDGKFEFVNNKFTTYD